MTENNEDTDQLIEHIEERTCLDELSSKSNTSLREIQQITYKLALKKIPSHDLRFPNVMNVYYLIK